MGKVSINELTLTNIGAAIREKTGKTDLIAPGDMPAEIRGIESGGGSAGIEPIELTGDCSYMCAGGLAGTYIGKFGDTVSTKDITKSTNMFYQNTTSYIPFAINYKAGTKQDLSGTFSYSKVKEIPVLNNVYPSSLSNLFQMCQELEELPEDFGADWNWESLHTYQYSTMDTPFSGCMKLRKIPDSFLSNLWVPTDSKAIYSLCNKNMYCLDELLNIPINTGANTSYNTMSECADCSLRLKNVTFALNEDGTPVVAKWKSQTLDFSRNVGWARSYGDFLSVANGNPPNKRQELNKSTRIIDDETYQALKDNPDSWTDKLEYSRYNRISAIATINTLPDTSATGTNTIKFKGQAGSATDGGSIGSMTAEEIAIAAAKGWTVVFS